jgi:AcrR family transcriptional regulator
VHKRATEAPVGLSRGGGRGRYHRPVPKMPRQLSRQALGGERLSREVLVAYQRERILTAAIGVFAKRGYQETTVDNIVAAAKGSVGGFYQHFDNKEDCFLGAFDRVVAQTREPIAAAVAAEQDWAGRAYAGLAALLEATVAEPLSARIVLIEAQTAGRAATARYRALCDEAAAWLRDGRELYPTARGLPGTFEQAAVTGTAYFLRQRLLAAEPSSPEELLAETSKIVLGPILGGAELRSLEATAVS